MPKKKTIDYAALYTLRKDGRYMGYWRDRNGKRHAIYDRDPQTLYARIKDMETPTRTKLSEVIDLWAAKHMDEVKRGTWINYAPHIEGIKAAYGDMPIDEVAAFTVTQDLLRQKARGYSYTIVNSRRCIWRMVLDYAVSDPNIKLAYNPALTVKNPKGLPKGKRSAPDDDVIDGILKGANDGGTGFIAFFFLCTGLRRSECLQRLKSDINTKTWEINIPTSKTEAGIRTVPIIKPLRDPLTKWMKDHKGAWLFPHIDYYAGRKRVAGYMTNSNWETAWSTFCTQKGWVDEDGKPTIGAHHLRHGTATLLFEAGVDPYTAQHILGHANVTTTLAIYTELRKKHERKNICKFSTVLSKMLSQSGKPLQIQTS